MAGKNTIGAQARPRSSSEANRAPLVSKKGIRGKTTTPLGK
jgi:hypothetical protein